MALAGSGARKAECSFIALMGFSALVLPSLKHALRGAGRSAIQRVLLMQAALAGGPIAAQQTGGRAAGGVSGQAPSGQQVGVSGSCYSLCSDMSLSTCGILSIVGRS